MAARHPDGSSKLNIAAWIGPDDQRLTRRRLRGPVIVHSMDRLARNLDDLRRLVRELTRRGVAI